MRSRLACGLRRAAAVVSRRVRLLVWCGKARQHHVEPNPEEMASRYGADTSVQDWREWLVCSQCGGWGIDVVVTATGRRSVRLATAALRLPLVLRLRVSLRLPLHVCDRIGATAFERLDVILDVAWERSARATIGRTRVRQLELSLDQGRSMLFGRSGAWQSKADGERGGNEQSGRHTIAELRTWVVSTASFSVKYTARTR
jgi:hypothetical protein